jgi:hypothetical protein
MKDSASVNNSEDRFGTAGIYKKRIKQYKFLLRPLGTEDLVKINYKNQDLSDDQLRELANEYKDYCCFKFEILVDGFNAEITEYYDKNDDKVNYEELVSYYLFGMQNDLKIFGADGNEMPCNIYFFERNYSLLKSNRFIIGFRKPAGENFTFSYNNTYLNIGKVNFLINKQDFTS